MLIVMLNNLVDNAFVSLALVSLLLLAAGEAIFPETTCSWFRNDRSVIQLRGPPDAMLS